MSLSIILTAKVRRDLTLGSLLPLMSVSAQRCYSLLIARELSAVSIGTCHFKGTIDGSEEGEVVFLTGNGSFVETAKADWTIDEKTAVGGLKGLKGKGGYEHGVDAKWDEETSVWLECSL